MPTVSLFDKGLFHVSNDKVVGDNTDNRSLAAKADTIAHATKRVINERLEQDPAFYLKFSNLIQKAIDDFRARRLSELEYLKKVTEIRRFVVCRQYDDLPVSLRGNEDAAALYGVLKPVISPHITEGEQADDMTARVAVELWEIIQRNRKVGSWDGVDAQRRTVNEIDDYLYDDVKDGKGVLLSVEDMNAIIESSMQLARHRLAS